MTHQNTAQPSEETRARAREVITQIRHRSRGREDVIAEALQSAEERGKREAAERCWTIAQMNCDEAVAQEIRTEFKLDPKEGSNETR
jgi:hypothetical protein